MDTTVVLGRHGPVTIPPDVRVALGLEPGDLLLLRVSGRRVVLESRRHAADELLAERRRAAASE